ncbi:hypothetical protein ACFSQD_00120 [Flavihumibacter stibioxidans]|uniref:Uncharacterized protein n=1 Tax=Flavihumibacter stibioxidans TaxID=1834163 RepID=A0ABR7ME24_9BACT|nr:hypothetical protein [Flavihumibacter stibioxidans]MBC6492906.1 hypothetical protein [Flavihumibacter stibioxidans]
MMPDSGVDFGSGDVGIPYGQSNTNAAHTRTMRKANGLGDGKPWITGKVSGIDSVIQASYDGVGLITLPVSAAAASETFDEGLSKDRGLSNVSPFIVQ